MRLVSQLGGAGSVGRVVTLVTVHQVLSLGTSTELLRVGSLDCSLASLISHGLSTSVTTQLAVLRFLGVFSIWTTKINSEKYLRDA